MDIKLPTIDIDAHKGTMGKVAVIAGSRGMSGAAILSSKAALRSGSGLVYALVPQNISDIIDSSIPEVITKSFSGSKDYFIEQDATEILELISQMDALCIGPGLGLKPETVAFVEKILANCTKPILIDADGLNAISGSAGKYLSNRISTVITPHPVEFSRLCGYSLSDIRLNREDIATKFAKDNGVVVVLKGDKSIITDGITTHINSSGNPGMATAGSGDVLSGIILSFLGQGIEPTKAAILGTFLHGCAGDAAAQKNGQRGMISSDIIEYLPPEIKKLEN